MDPLYIHFPKTNQPTYIGKDTKRPNKSGEWTRPGPPSILIMTRPRNGGSDHSPTAMTPGRRKPRAARVKQPTAS